MANNEISILIQARDNATSTLKEVSRVLQQTGEASEQAEPKTGRFGSTLDTLASRVRFVAETFAIYKVGQTLSDFAGSSVAAAGQLEQTNISFQNLIGNTQQANRVFGELTKYANATPFESRDVTDAAKQLLAFGQNGDQVVGTIKQLGDVASAGGGDLQALSLVTGQVFAQGKMRAQDMYQVINDGGAGLIKVMAQNAGGMQNLTAEFDKGGIPAQQYFDAIKQATGKGGFAFEGAQKQAKTFNGQLSTLKDSATQFGEALIGVHTDPNLGLQIQPGGLFDRAKDIIGRLSDKLQGMGDAAGRGVGDLMDAMSKGYDSVKNFFSGLLNWQVPLSDFKAVLRSIRDFVGDELMPKLGDFANWFRNLPPVVQVGISPLLTFITHIHNLSGFCRDLIVHLHNTWDAFKQSTPVVIFGQYLQQVLFPAIRDLAKVFVSDLLPAVDSMRDSFGRLWRAANPGLTDAIKVVGALLGGFLMGILYGLVESLKLMVQGISFVIQVFSELIDWISNLIGWFGNLVGVVVNTVKSIGIIFSNLIPAAKDVLGGVAALFGGFGGLILHAIGDLGSLLYNSGKQLIHGLVNGMEDSFADVKGTVSNDLHSVLHAAHVPGFATGTQYAPGGLALVGERGPELVNLPRGSQVTPSNKTAQMLSGGGASVHIENMNVSNDMDLRRVVRDIGWRLQVGVG